MKVLNLFSAETALIERGSVYFFVLWFRVKIPLSVVCQTLFFIFLMVKFMLEVRSHVWLIEEEDFG